MSVKRMDDTALNGHEKYTNPFENIGDGVRMQQVGSASGSCNLHHVQKGRTQNHAGKCTPNGTLKKDQKETEKPMGTFPCRGEKTKKNVKEDQESAAEHKVVIDKCIETAGQGETPGMRPAGHELFNSEENKGKKGDDFGKVIELCVDNCKRRKGIHDSAEESAGVI